MKRSGWHGAGVMIVILGFLCAGCGAAGSGAAPKGKSSSKRPHWVDEPSLEYPKSTYLTGVGYAGNREDAENKALAKISMQFKIKVDSQSKVWEKYVQRQAEGKESVDHVVDIEDLTKISTDTVLEGASIVETWFDSVEAYHYALAILDRKKMAASLAGKINSLDSEAETLVRDAGAARSEREKLRLYKRAIMKLLERDLYNTQLRIADPGGRTIKPKLSLEELKGLVDEILNNRFLIGVEVGGDARNEVRSALIGGLTKQGFIVGGEGAAAGRPVNVLVKGRVTIAEADRRDPQFEHVRWAASFDLVDVTNNDNIFGNVSEDGREGHVSRAEAERRATAKMCKVLTAKIAGEISAYIFGIEE